MKYNIQKRLFLVKNYYELHNITLIQRAYRTHFVKYDAPNHKLIKIIISNFEKTGSVGYASPKSKQDSRKREAAKNQLKDMLSDFKSFSITKATSAIGVSSTLVFHILHDDLHLKPYKFHQWHKLEYQDYEKRLTFATWFLNQSEQTKDYLICSNEAYFYLMLPLNNQNNRIWSESQPCLGIETPLHCRIEQ